MGVAAGLLLIIIGGVLAFAVNSDPGGVLNLYVAGWVFLLVGAFAVGLSLWRMNAARRRTVMVRRKSDDLLNPGATDEQVEKEVEEHVDSDPHDPPTIR